MNLSFKKFAELYCKELQQADFSSCEMLAVDPVPNLTHCTCCDYSNGEYTEK